VGLRSTASIRKTGTSGSPATRARQAPAATRRTTCGRSWSARELRP
jgi:hypothetical protein